MGCTASVIDYEQQQEWARTGSVSVEARPFSKQIQAPEQSTKLSRELREEKVEDNLGEIFVDDELSKMNESERAMYDGSVDGYSKADFSINESVATKFDVSKSVATDDALYEDTSSESENDIHDEDTPDEVALYPISIDGDEDLSRGDSLIASSMAPDPIHNEEESDEENRLVKSACPRKASTRSQGDICFTPRSPESNAIEATRTICNMKDSNCPSFFPGVLNENAAVQQRSKSLNTSTKINSKATETSKGKSTNMTSQSRLQAKPDTSVHQVQNSAVSSAVSQMTTQTLARTSQISMEKAKLRSEINRLRQQIQKLETKAIKVEASHAFVKPSDHVSIDDDMEPKEEASGLLGDFSKEDLKLSVCNPVLGQVHVSKDVIPNGSTIIQEPAMGGSDTCMVEGHFINLDIALEGAAIGANPHDNQDEKPTSHIHKEDSSLMTQRMEDSRASLDSAHMQYSASTTDDDVLFGRSLDGSILQCVADEANVVDTDMTTTGVQDSINQKIFQEENEDFFAELQPLSPPLDCRHEVLNSLKCVENRSEIGKTPNDLAEGIVKNYDHATETRQGDTFDNSNMVPTENVNSNGSKKRQSENVRFSDVLQNIAHETDNQETKEFIEEENEEAFVKLLNADPWDKESKLDESKLLHFVACYPIYCSMKHSFEGFHGNIYPLSAMCALGASLPTIKKCYHAFPDAITKADAWVGTCLHYACSYHAPFHVVEYLAKKNPLALKSVNQFNRLPLHMACMFGADAEVVAYLTRKYPGASKKPDKRGMLPLHIACDSDIGIDSPNPSVVEVLAEAYPEACLTKCENGATPLAICIVRKAPIAVLSALIKVCPEALAVADRRNQIPLHSALVANLSLDTIILLAETYPNGLHTENEDNETPYQYGLKMELDTAILNILETQMSSC